MAKRSRTNTAGDFIDLVSMLPWWMGLTLALLSYVGFHLWHVQLDDSVLSQPTVANGLKHVLVSVAQFAVPMLCLIGVGGSAWHQIRRTRLAADVAAAKNADVLDGMSWREFEMLVGEDFRLKGFSVVETGAPGPDEGIDLVLRKNGEKYLVQCKQWRAYKVGVPIVRELYGAMAAKGATGGFVVTSGRFTQAAYSFAEGRNVSLMNGAELQSMIKAVRHPDASKAPQSDERMVPTAATPGTTARMGTVLFVPTCPRCAGPMVQKVAQQGVRAGQTFWGCAAFPKCRGTA